MVACVFINNCFGYFTAANLAFEGLNKPKYKKGAQPVISCVLRLT